MCAKVRMCKGVSFCVRVPIGRVFINIHYVKEASEKMRRPTVGEKKR